MGNYVSNYDEVAKLLDRIIALEAATDVDSSGSGPVQYAKYIVSGTPADTVLTWAHSDGAALLDLTTPTAPTAVGEGDYAVSAEIHALIGADDFSAVAALFIDGDSASPEIHGTIYPNGGSDAYLPLSLRYFSPVGGVFYVTATVGGGDPSSVPFSGDVYIAYTPSA